VADQEDLWGRVEHEPARGELQVAVDEAHHLLLSKIRMRTDAPVRWTPDARGRKEVRDEHDFA
jgi:hypothetical protein